MPEVGDLRARQARWRSWPALAAWMLALLIFPHVLQAGEVRSVVMQSFTRDHGLGSLSVHVLARDRQGVLWAGTERGAYRFDGRTFLPVTTGPGRRLRVNDMFLAPDGHLWVGAAQGLYRWDGDRLQRLSRVPVDDLRRIAGDGNHGVFVRHQRRMVHVDAQGRERDMPWQEVLAAGSLTDGPVLRYREHLWTSCGAQLCMRSDGGQTRQWGAAHGVPADRWITLMATRSGDLWVGGEKHLLHLAPGSRQFRAIASPAPVESLHVDARGRVLAGSSGRLLRWDGERWEQFGDRRSLQGVQIRDVLHDAGGMVWLATGGRGVLRWRGYGRIRNWSADHGLDSAPTWAIARDADGDLWLGNQHRGNLLRAGARHLSEWPQALRRNDWINTVALLPRARSMWVVFNAGTVLRYDLDTRKVTVVLERAGWAKFALFDARGRLWLGAHGGLWRIDGADSASPVARRMHTGYPESTRYLGGAHSGVDGLWLATSRGLLREAGGRIEPVSLSRSLPEGGFADVAELPDGRVLLAPVSGGLWEGRVNDEGGLDVVPVRDALLQDTLVHSLYMDGSGRLWAAGDAGVDVLAEGRWRRLDQNDGLAWDDMAVGAFHEDADGSVWLGTSGGVSHLVHPGAVLRERPLSAPVILQMRYGKAAVGRDGHSILPWMHGQTFMVKLATPGMAHGPDLQIQYRLMNGDGAQDVSWESVRERSLHYSGLAPGTYRLQMRLFDPALRAYSGVHGPGFTVRPPWWMHGWALALYMMLVLALVVMLWRLRTSRLRQRHAELEVLVAQRTQELENDKRQLVAAREALKYEATHDALTGLLNRGAAVRALVAALLSGDQPLGVLLIDLDHFKQVNDTYGHLTGDAVLVQCAQRLRRLVPGKTSLGRYGGEELVAIWPGLDRKEDLQQALAEVIDGRYNDGDKHLRVTCSVGVAWARPGDDVDSVLRRADLALYRAKRAGRARVEYASV